MTDQQRSDMFTLFSLWGLYLGQLSSAELDAFLRLEADGMAKRCYMGIAGQLGLARIYRAYVTEEMLND